jgi:1,4-alpha-glucan branching enzyme
MLNDAEDTGAIWALVNGQHGDPFSILGCHAAANGFVIRALAPGARSVVAVSRETGEQLAVLCPRDGNILFEGSLTRKQPYILQIDWNDGSFETEDPYCFPLLLSDFDIYLLAEGKHRDLAACLGAQAMMIDGVAGVRFAFPSSAISISGMAGVIRCAFASKRESGNCSSRGSKFARFINSRSSARTDYCL